MTQGQRGWTAFCKTFSGIPHLTIFGALKYPPVILYLAYLAVFGHVFERVKYVSWSQVFTKSVSGWLSHTFQILGHWKLFLGKSAIIWLYLPTLLESFQRLDNRKLLPMRLVCFVLIPYRQNDAKWLMLEKKVKLIFLKEVAFVALVFSIFRTLRWPSEPIEVLMWQFPFYQNQFSHIKASRVLIVIKLTISRLGDWSTWAKCAHCAGSWGQKK